MLVPVVALKAQRPRNVAIAKLGHGDTCVPPDGVECLLDHLEGAVSWGAGSCMHAHLACVDTCPRVARLAEDLVEGVALACHITVS